jgi:hypothetical protein
MEPVSEGCVYVRMAERRSFTAPQAFLYPKTLTREGS